MSIQVQALQIETFVLQSVSQNTTDLFYFLKLKVVILDMITLNLNTIFRIATRLNIIFFFAIFICKSSSAFSQNKHVTDSLEWEKLNDLTFDYFQNSKYDSSFFYAGKSIKLAAEIFGERSRNYAMSISNLGELYAIVEEYANAEPELTRSLAILETNIGKNDSDYATVCNNLATVYEKIGNYQKAEGLYKTALSVWKSIFGDTSYYFAQSLNNIGNFYLSKESYSSAEYYLTRAKKTEENLDKKNTSDYAQTLLNLAETYHYKGKFSLASVLYDSSLQIMEKTLTKQSRDYCICLNNVAAFYFDMNNLKKAELLYKECLLLQKKVFEKENTLYANTLNNLAIIYKIRGDFTTALNLFTHASNIYSSYLEKGHLVYAKNLNQIANLYIAQHDYKNAILYFNKSLAIIENKFGKNHPLVAQYCNSLGTSYLALGNYVKAKEYLEKALRLRKAILGNGHPDYAESFNNMALLSYAEKDQKSWDTAIVASIHEWENSIKQLLASFSENEKEIYLDNHLDQRDRFLSMFYYFNKKTKEPALNPILFEMAASLQGWLLNGSSGINSRVNELHDSALSVAYEEWTSLKKEYTYSLQLTSENQQKLHLNSDSLLQQSQTIEKQIIRKLPSLQEELNAASVKTAEIAAKLGQQEALVNWVAFNYSSPSHTTDSIVYAAFILLPNDSAVHFVPVFEQKSLDALLKQYYSNAGRGILKNLQQKASNKIDSVLYQLIWKPLLPFLSTATTLYIVPSGLLNKISFQSLSDPSGNLLLETKEIHLLNKVTEFKRSSGIPTAAGGKISLFGGADFNQVAGSEKPGIPESAKTANSNQGVWKYLKGSTAEINDIAAQFDLLKWNVEKASGLNASEERFKQLTGSNAPSILHIATHGYYLQPQKKLNDHPLLRSGFLLSGANQFWGKDTLSLHTEDGIVTAQEVANMNLYKTSLVTLSSCESALGDINNNEGVYGLQRAFKMAGAKNLLITLWQIPDEETRELMHLFYKGVLAGNSYYQSLKNAQLEIKKKFSNPAIWAAFELLEE